MKGEENRAASDGLKTQPGERDVELEKLDGRKGAFQKEAGVTGDEKLAPLRFPQQEADRSAWRDVGESLAGSVSNLKGSLARAGEHYE